MARARNRARAQPAEPGGPCAAPDAGRAGDPVGRERAATGRLGGSRRRDRVRGGARRGRPCTCRRAPSRPVPRWLFPGRLDRVRALGRR